MSTLRKTIEKLSEDLDNLGDQFSYDEEMKNEGWNLIKDEKQEKDGVKITRKVWEKKDGDDEIKRDLDLYLAKLKKLFPEAYIHVEDSSKYREKIEEMVDSIYRIYPCNYVIDEKGGATLMDVYEGIITELDEIGVDNADRFVLTKMLYNLSLYTFQYVNAAKDTLNKIESLEEDTKKYTKGQSAGDLRTSLKNLFANCTVAYTNAFNLWSKMRGSKEGTGWNIVDSMLGIMLEACTDVSNRLINISQKHPIFDWELNQ